MIIRCAQCWEVVDGTAKNTDCDECRTEKEAVEEVANDSLKMLRKESARLKNELKNLEVRIAHEIDISTSAWKKVKELQSELEIFKKLANANVILANDGNNEYQYQLQELNTLLKETLMWYAEKDNYNIGNFMGFDDSGKLDDWQSKVQQDEGHMARAALGYISVVLGGDDNKQTI